MRTLLHPVQHPVRLHAPVENPVSDRVRNNLDLLLKELERIRTWMNFSDFTNIMRFGMQRF